MKIGKREISRNKLSIVFFSLSCLLILTMFIIGKKDGSTIDNNFRIVEKGKGSTYLVQEKICGGYYILEGTDLKSLQKPAEETVFDKATTIIDNLKEQVK